MPPVVVGVVLVVHGLITTMIGVGTVTNPNAPAMPSPSLFSWWPGPFGRSWLIDALHLGAGATVLGGVLWLVAGLALFAGGLGWLGVRGSRPSGTSCYLAARCSDWSPSPSTSTRSI